MTERYHGIANSKTEGGEITLAVVVAFFRRNWKILVPLTLVLSLAAVTLLLSLPKSYQKNLTLRTDLSSTSEFLSKVDRSILPSQDLIGYQAVNALKNSDLVEVEIEPQYNAQTKAIEVTMRSRDKDALAGAPAKMVSSAKDGLSSSYLTVFEDVLQMRITRLEGLREEKREVLDRVRRAGGDSGSLAEASALVTLATAEADLESAQQTREDLPRLITDAFYVAVAEESGAVRSRVPAALFFLAVAGSLAVAVVLALLREALTRRK